MKHFFFKTYFIFIFVLFFTIWGVEEIANYYILKRYHETIIRENQELSKGVFYMVQQELKSTTPDKFKNIIEELQPEFGYPLQANTIQSFQLTQTEQKTLNQGKIIVKDDGNFHIQKVGNTNYALSMGPFSDFSLKPLETTGIFVVGFFIFGIFFLLWSFFFWNKLRKISDAAASFGKGDFSARADISSRSSLTPIVTTFNTMAEQIEKLISSHKQLINAVSHELRTPISRIKFGIESLHTSAAIPKNELKWMRRDVDELEDLVSELLSYSKFERSVTQLELEEVQILPWLKEYLKVAQETFNNRIIFHCPNSSQSCLLSINQHHFERAIHNLLQNANKFTHSQIELTLEIQSKSVTISIDDDGPGISEKDRDSIFDPFVKLDSSRNKKDGGYGLGLSIVYEIIKQHNGKVTVEDSKLGGCRFTISLPIVTTMK